MLRILKEEFSKESSVNPLLLTAAVGVGRDTVEVAYDVPGMSQYLDLINLMTYDLHGAWEDRTGCNAPLYTTGFNAPATGACAKGISTGENGYRAFYEIAA